MKQAIRILIALLALAGGIVWTMFTQQVWQGGGTGAGAGDGAGGGGSGGAAFFGFLLIGVIWLLPVSPYLCMLAGALNLIEGKLLRVAYVYALAMLALMTLIMLVSFQPRFEFIAVGNVVVGSLWAWGFREKATGQ